MVVCGAVGVPDDSDADVDEMRCDAMQGMRSSR